MIETVGFVGDLHCNTRWACHVVDTVAPRLEGDEKILFQLGDFGYWPGIPGYKYMGSLNEMLKKHNTTMLFVDGNHEDHPSLRGRGKMLAIDVDSAIETVPIMTNISWMPRGYRFGVNGRQYLAVGGAASVDKAWRTEDEDWFPEELITDDQEAKIIAGGTADVIISHDRPSGAYLFLPSGVWPDSAIVVADAHRERMQRIYDAVKPSYGMHGHYHMADEITAVMDHGKVRMNCFNCDGTHGNWGVMNTETMEWVAGG